MKKTIALLLVILLMFNFIFLNSAYAIGGNIVDPLTDASGQGAPDVDEESSTFLQEAPASNEVLAEVIEQGTVSQTQDGATKVTIGISGFMKSAVGALTGILSRIINVFFAIQTDMLLSQLTYTEETSSSGTKKLKYWITIERMVFNRVALLNINYFSEGDYEVGETKITESSTNKEVKEGIAKMYYACRIIALAIGMVVLIYIGIRMAISTVASDQAKYKKMLVSWVESILILFLMPYIMSVLFWFGEFLTGLFYGIEQNILGSSGGTTGAGTYNVFEETVRNNSMGAVISLSGLTVTMYSIIYWCMLFLIFKFLWTYMKRLLMVGFLIIISPLITVTYAIDKVGDGKAQAFSIWMKEFTINVLIQPLHALIYMVFVLTANQLAAKSPLLALALLFSLGQVEKMVKVIFDLKINSLNGMDKLLKKG